MGAAELLYGERAMAIDQDDVELVRRMAAGDEEALRALYAAYGQRMYAYAFRLTTDAAVAEEVVQDCLVAAWQGARRFRGEGRVIAWLLGIVHHKALNTMRGRPPALELPTGSAEPPAREPAPEEQAVRSERAHLVRAGLGRLSPKHRVVLELVFYQGLTLNEVAQVCRCPLGTVKSRLSYAKEYLHGLLDKEGLSAEDVE